MKPLPESDNALVLRTDFSENPAWEIVRASIGAPVDGFYAYVDFVDDIAYEGLGKAQLLELFKRSTGRTFVIVADRMTMTHPEHPLLVVDLHRAPGGEFRALPRQIQSIENNLSIANMDFEEFAAAVDHDGVFRGFREP